MMNTKFPFFKLCYNIYDNLLTNNKSVKTNNELFESNNIVTYSTPFLNLIFRFINAFHYISDYNLSVNQIVIDDKLNFKKIILSIKEIYIQAKKISNNISIIKTNYIRIGFLIRQKYNHDNIFHKKYHIVFRNKKNQYIFKIYEYNYSFYKTQLCDGRCIYIVKTFYFMPHFYIKNNQMVFINQMKNFNFNNIFQT